MVAAPASSELGHGGHGSNDGSAGSNEHACEAKKELDGWPGEEDASRSRNGRHGSSARWQWLAW